MIELFNANEPRSLLRRLRKLRTTVAERFRSVGGREQKRWLDEFEGDAMYPQLVEIHKYHVEISAKDALEDLLLAEDQVRAKYAAEESQFKSIWDTVFDDAGRSSAL